MSPKEGALGKPVPGHQVAIIDDTGQEVPTGDIGKIAIKKPDPGMMLEYLSQKRSIEDKFIGDWLDTGDIGFQDRDGHFWFVGRADNRATAEGSRIPLRQVKLLIEQHQDVEAVLVARTPPKDLKASEGDEVITAVVHPSESTEQFQRLESEIYTLMMSFFENHTLSEGTNHIPRVLTNESAVSSMNQSELT
jgi:acetyl-CoA synthetase